MNQNTASTSLQALEKIVNRVTFADLCQSVRTAVETGWIGTPVNVRLHWQIEGAAAEFSTIAAAAVALSDIALKLDEPTWRVRRHTSGRTLHVLGSDRRGRTLMITLVAEAEPATDLTVFGNHGVVRLADGWGDPNSIQELSTVPDWLPGLQAAIGE